jgi:hypothetical protein
MRKLLLTALCAVSLFANAQKKEDTIPRDIIEQGLIPMPHVFTLGQVVVTSPKPISSVISVSRLERFARTDVSHALDLLPGVNVTAVGPRSESMVYVRGF